MKKKVIMLVGLPRSGKSTWARKQGLPVLCPDAVRLALHGERFLLKAEPMVWTVVGVMFDALMISNDTIIFDATNVEKGRREQWFKKYPNIEFELKVFKTHPEVCVQRAVDTGQEDLIPIIYDMAKKWDLQRPRSWDKQIP